MARTFILAWVIGLLGLVMIGGGIWGVIDLTQRLRHAQHLLGLGLILLQLAH